MPPPLPQQPLGIELGARESNVSVDIFVDLCCPFSKKIFKTIYAAVFPWLEQTNRAIFKFHLTPQPWHPQSPMMAEAVLAVQRLTGSHQIVLGFIDKLFDCQEQFFDTNVYFKSRQQIYDEIADVAAEFADRAAFLELLALKVVEGSLNTGNEMTQSVKWCVKYHRSCGVHVTPTCFVNNIEAGQISSGWLLPEWKEFLTPMLP